jgi:hypothetical protein
MCPDDARAVTRGDARWPLDVRHVASVSVGAGSLSGPNGRVSGLRSVTASVTDALSLRYRRSECRAPVTINPMHSPGGPFEPI